MDITSMTLDDLKELKNAIMQEINERETKINTSDLIVYIHSCEDSSNYHKNKYKHWSKVIKGIDGIKCNGYALIGDFLTFGCEHMVPKSSIVVETCDDTMYAFLLDGCDNPCIAQSNRKSMSKFIQIVANHITI